MAPSSRWSWWWTAPNFSEPTTVNRYRTLITPPSTLSYTFPFELEPVVYSGVTPLRNFQVRVWEKDAGYAYTDTDFYDDCNLAGGFTILYMPAEATLRRYACGNLVTITTLSGAALRGELLPDPPRP